ncbi:MAG: Rpn family recombination-promoting nuclease/putative transposase [Clostridia bacterium]|nr:Rpn family recombination-promoting nuclease/putative transposase [Clostridia bacterium]MDD4048652.1 Rpn family recombination-promoting nuclease/putative transposase [Clostridia bacterium]
MAKYPLMSPVVDFVFKQIFAGAYKESKTLLMDLLNAILGLKEEEKIEEITYLNPYNDKEYKEGKISILDIKVKTQDDKLIDIEVQINNKDSYRKRALYYWAKMYAETIEEGEAYETLKRCVVVNLLDFKLLPETDKYHSVFRIKDIQDNYELLEDLELHYIELPKFKEQENITSMGELEKWLVFIKEAGNESKQEIVTGIRKESEVIDMAGKILETLSQDEAARQRYYQRQKWLLDEKSMLKYQQIQLARVLEQGKKEGEMKGIKKGIKEGIKKGIKEGEKKGIKEGEKKGEMKKTVQVVKESLAAGLPIEVIAIITKLSEEEILRIKDET